jgi:DNA-binding NarL/FixJ family response regulator
MDQVRVLIVEDETIIAENIAMYLNNSDFIVSGIADDDEQAVQELKFNTPDAAILDINLGCGRDGIDIAQLIKSNYSIPFVFLTSYCDKATLGRAKNVEPSGYIVKPFHENTLLASLEMALHNHAKQHNSLLPKLDMDKINKSLPTPLTERECEVLQLIYDGNTNNQIANNLYRSINTIKRHINNAYLKLDAETRTSAIVRLRDLMSK